MKLELTHDNIDTIIQITCPFLTRPKQCEQPSLMDMKTKLEAINPKKYGQTRNYLNGQVTQLSRYISSGCLSIDECVQYCVTHFGFESSTSLIQQLFWRIYFKHQFFHYPHIRTHSVGEYKTGWQETDYATSLPMDIVSASTPNAIINHFIHTLVTTGYLHNHARLYLASYIVHFRRILWQVGAEWMFHHLVDADVASNFASWQWIASTSSMKPYVFNLENIQKYVPSTLPTSEMDNPELVGSYETIHSHLFKQGGHV